jgi:hypothetical protein
MMYHSIELPKKSMAVEGADLVAMANSTSISYRGGDYLIL